MSEFCINLSVAKAQQNYLSNVTDSIQACLKMVENANDGLDSIGIGEVSAALDALVSRMGIHKAKCESLVDVFDQIIRRFQQAENAITDVNPIVVNIEKMIDKVRDIVQHAFDAFEISPSDGTVTDDRPNQDAVEYVGVMYLIGNERAGMQGHAAIALVYIDENGEYQYEYYSYYANGAFNTPGFVGTNMQYDLDGNGTIDTSLDNTEYSNYIFIPTTDEQGVSMSKAAYDLVNNPGNYDLLQNNCNINVQKILSAADLDFAQAGFDGVATRPNTVYKTFLAEAQANPYAYEGYKFGAIDGNDISSCFTDDRLMKLASNPWSVSDVTNATFYDCGEFVEVGLNKFIISRGITTEQILDTWNQFVSIDSAFDAANFAIDANQWLANCIIDESQSALDFSIDTTQSFYNSGIDWVQDNYISNSSLNSFIDGGQALYNGFIDGRQALYNGVVDGVQDLYNGAVDELQSIGQNIADSPVGQFLGWS